MNDVEDALGHELLDYLEGKEAHEIIERDDDLIDVSNGPATYFAEYDAWHEHERLAIEYAHGRILDIGCGAGRHALYLQEQGLEVVGIDNSPLAVEVCRRRGVRDVRLLSLTGITKDLGSFDTMIMMGNNFGLFANPKRARWMLRRFRRMMPKSGLIVATSINIYHEQDPDHVAYHRRNVDRGRMPGQVRIRVRYRRYRSPWFDYLLVSQGEMEDVVAGTGWKIDRIIMPEGPSYAAIIRQL